MLNVPKKAASWSVSGTCALASALNCQPPMVVANADSPMTQAIDRR